MTHKEIGPVAVIGGGTMGPGIAVQFAAAGYTVNVVDISSALLERTRKGAVATAGNLVVAGHILPDQLEGVLNRINYTTDLDRAVGGIFFAVEVVPEVIAIKEQVFAQLEAAAPPDAVLASNTSGIEVTRLQQGRVHPGRIVGTHWSNPPHVVPLIEIVAGQETTAAVLATTEEVIKSIGMVPVHVRCDIPGFVKNRILHAIMREALHLLDSGVASAQDIDNIVRWGIGMKLSVIGPLELLDMAGLDVYRAVAQHLNQDLNNSGEVSARVLEHTNRGELGIKTGGGLFKYDPAVISELQNARDQALLAVRKLLEDQVIPRPVEENIPGTTFAALPPPGRHG